MTDKITLTDNDIKDFVFCDICACDGYPYEKVVFIYTGFRSEEEDGFAYRYTVNDYENPNRIHIHRSSKQISGTSYLCGSYQEKNTSLDQRILDRQLQL